MTRQTIGQTIRHALSAIDEQRPQLKYYSLGLYGAWILLMMGGTGVAGAPSSSTVFDANVLLYLYSGMPLSVVLIVCGLLHERVEPHIVHGPLVPIMSVVASLCTAVVAGGFGTAVGHVPFALASVGTGVGTAFLCLRLGYMYSTLDSKNVLFTTFASGILADLVYFTCAAIDGWLSLLFLSLMPLLSMVLALLRREDPPAQEEEDKVPVEMLPRGFFTRCVLFVAVFSMAIGITKGMSTLTIPAAVLKGSSHTGIFVTMAVLALLCSVFAVFASIRRFDISKIYYPVIIVAALGMLLAPLLGQGMLQAQVIVVNSAYNVFILALWCVFSNIAGQTDMSPVRMFGLGRGASAIGTTSGHAIAAIVVAAIPDLGAFTNAIGVAFTIVIIVMSIFVLDERTISDALDKTFREETVTVASPGAPSPELAWGAACDGLAERCGLTAREREVLSLLGRGRTASYIADELGISYNTAKGHIRNLYAKCGVHSRQELIDLLEEMLG